MKKIISLLMVLCLMASLCSMSAFAEEVLPKASVSRLDVNNLPGKFVAPDEFTGPLTCAYSFSVDMEHMEQNMAALEKYADWTADFILTVNNLTTDETILFNALDSNADAYLSGQYSGWGGSGANYDDSGWVHIPIMGYSVTLSEGQDLPIMATIIDTVGGTLGNNFRVTCAMIAAMQTFNCGVHFREEFLAANPFMTVSLSLWITNPETNESKWITGLEITPIGFQAAVNNSDTGAGSSKENPLQLPESVPVNQSIRVSDDVYLALETSSFKSNTFKPAAGVDSIFTLEKGASVTITNVEGNAEELKMMRELVSPDYCVSKGSIVIRDAHTLGDGSTCKYCGVSLVSSSVPMTADNSNMPLWGILFIGFAAVAVLTAKKKKA